MDQKATHLSALQIQILRKYETLSLVEITRLALFPPLWGQETQQE